MSTTRMATDIAVPVKIVATSEGWEADCANEFMILSSALLKLTTESRRKITKKGTKMVLQIKMKMKAEFWLS